MATYNQFQQLYCLSAASNAVGMMKGSEKDLQAAMDVTLAEYIPQLTGNWSVTWGPRVFKETDPDDTTTGPDNAWFAAVSATQKLCVVAVAGTARFSKPDQQIDLDVQNVVDFKAWTNTWPSQGVQPASTTSSPAKHGTAYVAQGTCIGVYNILSTPSNQASSGQLLGDYIAKSVPKDYQVIFTGHSMGGAVAPTVALGLINAQKSPVNNTFILPSAGPSPGNTELNQAFAAVFPPGSAPPASEPYAVFNTDFFNKLDIVPQAWSLDASSGRYLNNINNIYSNASVQVRLRIEALLKLAIERSQDSNITYEPILGTSFTGSPVGDVETWQDFEKVAMREHTTEYWEIIGIQPWVQQVINKLSEQPGVEEPSIESRLLPSEDEAKDL